MTDVGPNEPTDLKTYVPRRNGVGGNRYYKGRLGTQGGSPAYYAGPGAGGQKEGGWQPLISDNVKARMIESLNAGVSLNRVARLYGVDPMVVGRLAQEFSIDTLALASTHAQEARRDYAQIERLRVINLAFERIELMLDDNDLTARDLKDLAIAMGISIDKRRLEDGEATERSEISDLSGARTAVRNKLLEIAERRRGLAPGTLMREMEAAAQEVAPMIIDVETPTLRRLEAAGPEREMPETTKTNGVSES